MKAEIIVTLKPSVFDPQGDAVRRAMHHQGMECVDSVRIGKYIELQISGKNVEKTRVKLEQICHDLLSNPVIEDYNLKLDDGKPVSAAAKLKALIETAEDDSDDDILSVKSSPSKIVLKKEKDKKSKKDKKKDKKKKKKDKKKKKNKHNGDKD